MATYHLNNVSIGYKNFTGAKGQYNAEGARNFHVFFNDMSEADYYAKLGFNVKYPDISESVYEDYDKDASDYVPRPHMKVNVNLNSMYGGPKIALITVSRDGTIMNRQILHTPEEVAGLDNLYISHAEIDINDYHYNGGANATAYLKTLYAEVMSDDYYERYGI